MAKSRAVVESVDEDLANIYNQLAAQLSEGVNAQQTAFNQAGAGVGSIYDQMTNALQGQANATASGLGNEFNMLGIGAATDSATNDLRGQLNQSLISAARRRATEMSGLTQQGASYAAAGRGSVANVQREGSKIRSDARTRLEETIAALEAQAAAAGRGGGGGGGGGGSPLEMLRAQLLGLQVLEKQQELEMGPKSQWSRGGQGGLNQFLNTPSDYWSNRAGTPFRAKVQQLIDLGSRQANNPASIAAGIKDPYLISSQAVSRSRLNQDALRQAMQIYYGKAK